jgi:membrane protein YdbS with pleckstrin-like domain
VYLWAEYSGQDAVNMKGNTVNKIYLSSENYLSTKLHGVEIEQTAVFVVVVIIIIVVVVVIVVIIPSPFPLRRWNLSHPNSLLEH